MSWNNEKKEKNKDTKSKDIKLSVTKSVGFPEEYRRSTDSTIVRSFQMWF